MIGSILNLHTTKQFIFASFLKTIQTMNWPCFSPTPSILFIALLLIFGQVSLVNTSQDFDDQEGDFFRQQFDDVTTQGTPKKCKPMAGCLTHSDCAGTDGKPGKPRCIGGLVGKCDCTACVAGMPCQDDSKCGGLKHGCDHKAKICNCLKAAQFHYGENPNKKKYPTLMSSITDLCTNEDCHNSPVDCYGLPCKKGVCVCA